MRRVAIGSCLLVALSGSPSASGGLATTATPFRLGEHHEPIVGVRVDGEGPFPFILDTGSTHSSIATELARALNVPAVARTTVISSLGQHVQPVVNLESLQVGPATTTNVLATEVADEELGNKRNVRGVLGQDVLGSLVYTLDFAPRRVEWNPESARSRRFARRLISVLHVGDFWQSCRAESTLWLVPDSGAESWCSMNAQTCGCRCRPEPWCGLAVDAFGSAVRGSRAGESAACRDGQPYERSSRLSQA